jgi:hypothetical protein
MNRPFPHYAASTSGDPIFYPRYCNLSSSQIMRCSRQNCKAKATVFLRLRSDPRIKDSHWVVYPYCENCRFLTTILTTVQVQDSTLEEYLAFQVIDS